MRGTSHSDSWVKTLQNSALVVVGITVAAALGCKGGSETEAQAAAEKKALEAAATEVKQPVGVIAAYLPHLRQPARKEKYAPKRGSDVEKATLYAANEIRYAANGAKQKIERNSAASTKDLIAALQTIAGACAEASDDEKLEKCAAAVGALDAALQKTEAAGAAAGVTTKYPRVAPEAITEEAKKAIAPFLKARGPGAAETAYQAKRSDAAVSMSDVISACQAAADETDGVSRAYEKADEPIRIIAVTHKMSVDSQCNGLKAAEAIHKDVNDCRKKAKSSECKIVCAKAKTVLDDGIPAAAFAPLEKDYAEICAEK